MPTVFCHVGNCRRYGTKSRLQDLAKKGNPKAKVALELANAPNQFLSTVQIGITLVGILAGAFGGRTIADRLAAYLSMIPAMEPYSQAVGLGVVVMAITYLSLIIGELVPKRLPNIGRICLHANGTDSGCVRSL